MKAETRDVLKRYLIRLHQSVRRSGLLYAFPTRSIKRLDITRLKAVRQTLPRETLDKLISHENGKIQFDLDIDSLEGTRREEHEALYHILRNGLARTAEAFKRETGVRSLWLAYPLFHAIVDKEEEDDHRTTILAPVFLWPIRLEVPMQTQGRITIARDEEAGGPKYNKSLDLWIKEHLAFSPEDPRLDDFAETSLDDLENAVRKLYKGFRNPPTVSFEGPPQSIPSRDVLRSEAEPKILHAGVIGLIQWEHQAIIRDFEALQKVEGLTDLVSDYLCGARRDTPPPVKAPPEVERFLVTDADPSQEQAVWRARSAPGVVVHGPPGTGKSQTIVNIVADALALGQRVLVVCQKRAAIDVVAERLKAKELDDLFCVVHDSESDRAGTILAIKDQIANLSHRLIDRSVHDNRVRLSREITSLEKQLDDYCLALNERGKAGYSYRELFASSAQVFYGSGKQQPNNNLKGLFGDSNREDLLTLEISVGATGALWDDARPLTNVWRHRKDGLVLDPMLQDAVRTALGRLREADKIHTDFVTDRGVGVVFSFPAIEFLNFGRDWHSTVSAAIAPGRAGACARWLERVQSKGIGICEEATRKLSDINDACQRIQAQPARADLFARFTSLTPLQGQRLLEDLRCISWARQKWWRRFGKAYRRAGKAVRQAGFWKDIQSHRELMDLDERLAAWLDRQIVVQALTDIGVSVNGGSDRDLISAVDTHQWALQFVQAAVQAAESEQWFASVCKHLATEDLKSIEEDLGRLATGLERATLAADLEKQAIDFEAWLKPEYLATLQQRCRAGETLASEIEFLDDGFRRLGPLDQLDRSRLQWEGLLRQVLTSLEIADSKSTSFSNTGDRWWAVVQLSALKCWREQQEKQHPVLSQLTPQTYEANRKRLGEAVSAKRSLEPQAILERWRQKQATHTRAHFSGVLVSRGRNSKRLREVVELGKDIGLFDFRPCWLTNPNTASQIFPLMEGFFDLVIFDEASQCPVEQAIPVIYRAKRVVVAGDEKQLPPTSFFKSSFSFADDTEPEDSDEEVITDESALQQRITEAQRQQALGVEDLLEASKPLLHESLLQVHYRSEHPSLIQFSNAAFYSGQLLIPPSVHIAGNSAAPLVLIEANGVYEKKSNLVEARRVVELIRELWLDHTDNPTVGVVTFNEVQRDLIEDLLQEEAAKDPVFRARFEQERARQDGHQDVGFFVKNLESVQGDERDIMVFSTTFGRDPQGRFRRFFGPLNQLGGERRLNVAITRAKRRNYLVTSMPLSEISERCATGDIGPGGAVTGRDYLHGYMQYVRAVSNGDQDGQDQALGLAGKLSQSNFRSVSVGEEESPFEVDVRDAIESIGYSTVVQVGEAGFRIDIAILHPKPECGYLLGIECDGKTYHSGWSARARDVWRQQILERRGWNIHRIWSTNWWLNRDAEIQKIQAKLAVLVAK